MDNLVESYFHILDALRLSRASSKWQPHMDRPWLAKLEDMYNELSWSDQILVSNFSWRGWPDEYKKRVNNES